MFSRATDLVSLLVNRAAATPDRLVYRYLGETSGPRTLTFGELRDSAGNIASHLRREGSSDGERALLLFPPGLSFVQAFMGALSASIVAVPAPPPNPLKPKRSLERLSCIVESAKPTWALTTRAILDVLRPVLQELPAYDGIRWICVDEVRPGFQPHFAKVDGRAPALIQYTSGSTSDPKGATLSHANLLHNMRYFDQGWDHDEDSVVVNWLPAFHDLGLVYGVLAPIFGGFTSVQMSPIDVIQQPRLWLEALSTYKGTHSGGPNFIYDLCVRKVKPHEVAGLDLSHWKMALTAAEPVRAETLERFTAHFADAGFRYETFCPGYGLSEGTCKVTAVACVDKTTVLHLRADQLERDFVELAEPGGQTRAVVGCGRPGLGVDVRIVDPKTGIQRPGGRVGEIWVSGLNVAHSYWGREQETRDRLQARMAGSNRRRYLRTGDLGFLHDGELFITGRIKDVIIVRGANHYPQDVEFTVQDCHGGIRAGCVAAFAFEVDQDEQVAVVAEVARSHVDKVDLDEVAGTIMRSVAENHGLRVHRVALIRSGTIPKTTSGKIRRQACKHGLLNGRLARLGTAPVEVDRQPVDARQHIRDQLVEIVCDATKLPRERVDQEASLYSLGVDSLAGVNIAYEIGILTGQDVPDSLISDRDTIGKLVEYVVDMGVAT